MDTFTALKLVGSLVRDAATYEERKPITIEVPDATTVVDLTEFGLGKAQVVESKGTITVTKID